jgi:hypothetical protein
VDLIDDYTAQDLSARQREVMKLVVQGLSAEVCLALAHKTKELDTRAASPLPWR